MAPAVTLRSAVALLGRFPALAGVDLDVEEGAIVSRARAQRRGQDEPAAPARGAPRASHRAPGTVLGMDLDADRRALRRHVGLLGHHLWRYPELSATENLDFGAPRAARGPRERRR